MPPDAIAVQVYILQDLISSNSNQQISLILIKEALSPQFYHEVHCVINGTMCTLDSTTTPKFFLHHGFVDKILWDWQKLSPAHKFNTYFVSQTAVRSKPFLDLNNKPDCVCAEYVNPKSSAFGRIKGLLLQTFRLMMLKKLLVPQCITYAQPKNATSFQFFLLVASCQFTSCNKPVNFIKLQRVCQNGACCSMSF